MKLSCVGPIKFKEELRNTKRARGTYRQTGVLDKGLVEGVLTAATAINQKKRKWGDFLALEDEVAKQMKKHCAGTKVGIY